MHTLAKVMNANLADGDAPEPVLRVSGEEQIVADAHQLIANTADEARELVDLYEADSGRVQTVAPGVNLEVFRPGDKAAARERLKLPRDAYVLLFVGRIQPLKAPDVLVRAAAELLERRPELRSRLVVVIVGGPSGSGRERPEELQKLTARLGLTDIVRFEPPQPQPELAEWYRAADVTVVPSHNESFGLVAVEAQACGTPVVASAVGGLRTAVGHGVSGLLVNGHDPRDYATVLERLADEPLLRERLGQGAVRHARVFGWDATAGRLLGVYKSAVSDRVCA